MLTSIFSTTYFLFIERKKLYLSYFLNPWDYCLRSSHNSTSYAKAKASHRDNIVFAIHCFHKTIKVGLYKYFPLIFYYFIPVDSSHALKKGVAKLLVIIIITFLFEINKGILTSSLRFHLTTQ